MKIEYYKSNLGVFFRIPSLYYINGIYINGIEIATLTKLNGGFWKLSDIEIYSAHKMSSSQIKHMGWKLKDQNYASEQIPATLSPDQLKFEWDDDGDFERPIGEFASIAALYEKVTETIAPSLSPIEFELVLLGQFTAENADQPEKTTITLMNDSNNYGAEKTKTLDLSSIVTYDMLTSLVVPEFMIHHHPCTLTSHQVYKIVRHHIRQNINAKYASISSDYDFCFSVDKNVFTKPYHINSEQYTKSGRSYKPPRFTNSTKTIKRAKIFEMTYSGYKGNGGYGEYPCIEGWSAPSLAAMKEQMEQYLNELMLVINQHAHECEHCSGVGQIYQTIDTNDRTIV